MGRTRASGWSVEITHPNTGRTLSPEVLDDPQVNPSLNSMPEIRVPVRKRSAWVDLDTPAEMDVWLDGVKQPIDELRDVEQRTDRSVLVGMGGVELETRVTESYDNKRRYIAAEELINDYTSYDADVSEPTVADFEDQFIRALDTTQEFSDAINPAATDPVDISNGSVQTYDVTWPIDIQTFTSVDPAVTFFSTEDGYESGSYALFDAEGQYIEFEWSNAYELPADTLIPKFHAETETSNRMQFDIDIDGQPESAATVDELDWYGVAEAGASYSPGTHTIRIEVDNLPDGPAECRMDFVDLVDDRFSYTFDDTLSSPQGHFPGPQLKPDAVTVETTDGTSAFSIIAGEAILTVDDTSGAWELAISNDQGSTYPATSNTNTVSADFASGTSTLRWKATLSRYGTQTGATPTTGVNSQTISDSELRADIEQALLLVDEEFDNDLESVLNDVAAREEFLWSYRLVDGTPTISWAQPGQRVAESDPNLAATATLTKEGTIYPKITVKGSPQQVSGERFTASTSFVNLTEDNFLPGSEAVFDPDTGDNFLRGDDYELDRPNGQIRILSSGNMTAGDTYAIDYQHEISGSYTAQGAGSDPRERVVELPGIVSEQQAEQFAFVLVRDLNEPRYTVDASVPRGDVTFDTIEAFELADLELPAGVAPLEVTADPEITPTGLVVEFGSRPQFDEVLSQLRDQLNRVAKRS